MRIFMTFVSVKYSNYADELELAHAWDEYCVDSNYEGYVESRQKALDSYGNELAAAIDTVMELPMGALVERLRPLDLQAPAVTVIEAPEKVPRT